MTAYKKWERGQLASLVAHGKNDRQIAASLHVSVKTVMRWRHADGLEAPANQHPIRHGLDYTYRFRGCRCELCTAAATRVADEKRRKRTAMVQAIGLPDHNSHGASAYGNWGCRCDICTAAYAIKNKRDYEARKHA